MRPCLSTGRNYRISCVVRQQEIGQLASRRAATHLHGELVSPPATREEREPCWQPGPPTTEKRLPPASDSPPHTIQYKDGGLNSSNAQAYGRSRLPDRCRLLSKAAPTPSAKGQASDDRGATAIDDDTDHGDRDGAKGTTATKNNTDADQATATKAIEAGKATVAAGAGASSSPALHAGGMGQGYRRGEATVSQPAVQAVLGEVQRNIGQYQGQGKNRSHSSTHQTGD